MDANRLEQLEDFITHATYNGAIEWLDECHTALRQQQAEIERLNRAYEVLEILAKDFQEVSFFRADSYETNIKAIRDHANHFLTKAQRIKEEKDGEQG